VAEKTPRQLHLADLVMAALLCGLLMALPTSTQTPSGVGLNFFLICAVGISWGLFHQRRRASSCEECGRRFIALKPLAMPTACPHCGQEQVGRARSIRRFQNLFGALVGLLAMLIAAVFVLFGGSAAMPPGGAGLIVRIVLLLSMLITIFAALGIGLYRSMLLRPKDRPCEACGWIITVEPAGPKICPTCQNRHMSAEDRKKQNASTWAFLLGGLGVLSLFIAQGFAGPRESSTGLGGWLRFALLVLGIFVASVIGFIAILMLVVTSRRRQLRSESGMLATARKCAGRDGDLVVEGLLTVWSCGPDDPVPMLRKSIEAARHKFEALTGLSVSIDSPLRILVFYDRSAFVRFHQRIFPGVDFSGSDSFYLEHPYQLAVLCTVPGLGCIGDTDGMIRSMAGHALLESVWGPGPPRWLQAGLIRPVTTGDDRGGLAQLNRAMIAILTEGTAMSTEIFSLSAREVVRLYGGSKTSAGRQRWWQFVLQSWSIVEYLRGPNAPDDPSNPLGAFLSDPLSKTKPEDSFRLHFGLGYGPLLDRWRQWVLDQGIATYEPPTERIREGLLGRVLPTIRDREARRGDRLVAIRQWASAGSVLGADVLIGLLRDPGDVPKEDVAWALRMVSGMPWGDEPDRWQVWWDELPPDWDVRQDPRDAGSDGLEVTT
jgi:predicted RNA-binding Zn-ribbon protein involved in translation (DUF1610 family)